MTAGALIQDGVRRTGAELDGAAERAAATLTATTAPALRGRVAIATADRGAALAALVGAGRAGLVPVPISEAPPRDGSVEHDLLLRKLQVAAPAVVLADEAHGDLLAAAGLRHHGPLPVPGQGARACPARGAGNRRWHPAARPVVPGRRAEHTQPARGRPDRVHLRLVG